MILTIGAFDGFHRGHELLLDGERELSHGSRDWGVVTFAPHPGVFMGALSHTLFTQRERELLRLVLDIPNMFVMNFNERLKRLTPEEFWDVLKQDFHATGVVMGQDFRFGLGQGGSSESLANLCRRDGFPAKIIELKNQDHDGVKFSSTNIRAAIASGDPRTAMDLLGYPWFMCCSVTHGFQRGREMGFPTANLDIEARARDGGILPADGVYAAALLLDGSSWHGGALSIGSNPTFGDVHDTRAEIYVLDFHGDLYGREVPVFLFDRLRPMQKFLNPESLEGQIVQDVKRCREIFAATRTGRADFFERFSRVWSACETCDVSRETLMQEREKSGVNV